MTKEELEKEAEGWRDERYLEDMGVRKPCKQAYLAGAEPREKRIEELEVTNKKISNECHKLVDSLEKKQKEIAELEAQIEKMKCCANCEYTPPFDKHCDNCIRGSIKFRYMNWQLRR